MTATVSARHAARERSGAGSVAGEVALWIAAAAGVVCLVLAGLALALDITLMMFRTGSMAPTIPSGSVAVVREVPASDVEVGDVVTVDRGGGQLPVTHRVTSVSAGERAAERVITMRGDANESDDPLPYTVTTVREVLFSVPGVAPVIVWFGQPLVMAGLTLAAGVLVGWAFWPKGSRDDAAAPDRAAAEGA